jgi:hypothetical protein
LQRVTSLVGNRTGLNAAVPTNHESYIPQNTTIDKAFKKGKAMPVTGCEGP